MSDPDGVGVPFSAMLPTAPTNMARTLKPINSGVVSDCLFRLLRIVAVKPIRPHAKSTV